uniref:GAG-pre-integrase domain-containing protein n=1 Tax=Cajanus cajan TaxID=3821 RepID=A0A151U2X2_CAJCA|nr:hypothetical protein KK1_006264 [Cajanus cajan]
MSSSHQATSNTWVASQVWLHHKHLGHPPFGLLKSLFPHLFTKETVESFNCDICHVSKHCHASFLPSNNKSVSHLILSILMYGTIVESVSRARWFVTFIDDYTHLS